MMAMTVMMMMMRCRRSKQKSRECTLPHAQSHLGTPSGSLGVSTSYMMWVECIAVLLTVALRQPSGTVELSICSFHIKNTFEPA